VLLDLVVDPCEEIRQFANLSLDIIGESDEEWKEKIRDQRFELVNRHWIDAMNSGALDHDDGSSAGLQHGGDEYADDFDGEYADNFGDGGGGGYGGMGASVLDGGLDDDYDEI
jgi:hypothetical protein